MSKLRLAAVASALFAVGASCQPVVTIRIAGDFSKFSTGTIRLYRDGVDREEELVLTEQAAIAVFPSLLAADWEMTVHLEVPIEGDLSDQAIKEVHDAMRVITAAMGEKLIELNGIDEDGLLQWESRIELSRNGVTARFPVDPCEPFSALILPESVSACRVDADRALYDGPNAEGNLLAFIFGQAGASCDYDGGNIFSAQPIHESNLFSQVCADNSWQSADTLSCYETQNGQLECFFFAWENIDYASIR
ncbi:MAG: hypothetical protein ABFS46_18040 [Myxococcota bacterium]